MSRAAEAAPAQGLALAAHDHLAPAKLNLALHVTGRRADGYHLLSSLVVFADVGDRLTLAPAKTVGAVDSFALAGPFAASLAGSLPDGGDNSVTAAIRFLRAVLAERGCVLPPLAASLEKNLPVASGIGGGSADAGAILRLALAARPDLRPELLSRSVRLGADVPMCVASCPAIVSGIGEAVRPLDAFPALPALLVNPGVPVSTPAVFAALLQRGNPPLPEPPQRFAAPDDVVDYLRRTRNDLEAPAAGIAPVIAQARAAVEATGALLARMSGSGATVFGLYSDMAGAERAGRDLSRARPGWWVRPTRLGSVEAFER